MAMFGPSYLYGIFADYAAPTRPKSPTASGKFRWEWAGTEVWANSKSEARAKFKFRLKLDRLPPRIRIRRVD